MKTFSYKMSFKKGLLMSKWCTGQLIDVVRVKISLTIVGLIIGLKASWKSIPSVWWKPWATKWAFYLWIVPSELCLIWHTHLEPTMFIEDVGGTSVHVWFVTRALNSSCIAYFHTGLAKAAETVECMPWVNKELK